MWVKTNGICILNLPASYSLYMCYRNIDDVSLNSLCSIEKKLRHITYFHHLSPLSPRNLSARIFNQPANSLCLDSQNFCNDFTFLSGERLQQEQSNKLTLGELPLQGAIKTFVLWWLLCCHRTETNCICPRHVLCIELKGKKLKTATSIVLMIHILEFDINISNNFYSGVLTAVLYVWTSCSTTIVVLPKETRYDISVTSFFII